MILVLEHQAELRTVVAEANDVATTNRCVVPDPARSSCFKGLPAESFRGSREPIREPADTPGFQGRGPRPVGPT